jgi:2-C-methyl-D-erythritol 4-phosphate cytidylyltransferase
MPVPNSAACYALVPCAGVGQRAGGDGPKQYASLAGRPLVVHTLDALAAVPRVRATLVVLASDDRHFDALVPPRADLWVERCGGATRAGSVSNGLAALRRRGAHDDDWVLVHDAARCLLRPTWVDALIDACLGDDIGGLLALPLSDTLKQAVAGRAAATLDRSDKWAAQTPQMFRLAPLQAALAAAGPALTDEAAAFEAIGQAPRLVHGSIENLKVTWPQDFALAERLLESRGLTRRGAAGVTR